jgi:hypothetical protein
VAHVLSKLPGVKDYCCLDDITPIPPPCPSNMLGGWHQHLAARGQLCSTSQFQSASVPPPRSFNCRFTLAHRMLINLGVPVQWASCPDVLLLGRLLVIAVACSTAAAAVHPGLSSCPTCSYASAKAWGRPLHGVREPDMPSNL